jgi:hypothetical protein
LNAYNFTVQYSDGSIYQGRTYAKSLADANKTIMESLPEYPGDPEPMKLMLEQKQG